MTDTASALQMITCTECGKPVPENNMTIHRAHACRGRARSSGSTTNEDERDNNDSTQSTQPRQKTGLPKRDDDYNTDTQNDDPMDVEEVDDDDDDDDDSVEVIEKEKNDDVIEIMDDDEEWACDRCTLLNDKEKTVCVMCGTNRYGGASPALSSSHNDGVRSPDPVRRERLIGGDSNFPEMNSQIGDSPFGVVGSGALLGGVIGAVTAWSRGRPISSGAFEGGVAGAVGGAFLNEFTRSPTRSVTTARRSYSGPLENDMAAARSASATGQPSYPSMGTTSALRATRQPRSSFRVTEMVNPDGSTRFIVSQSSRSGSYIHQERYVGGPDQQLLNFLLASPLSRTHLMRNAGDIDNMTYDQLLALYGNGSENLGASPRLISTLPTAKVMAKADGTVDLPSVACECSVCLEKFEQGDIRKTLPCLHGFHADCIDKWLHTNACCPVCKFRVEENAGST